MVPGVSPCSVQLPVKLVPLVPNEQDGAPEPVPMAAVTVPSSLPRDCCPVTDTVAVTVASVPEGSKVTSWIEVGEPATWNGALSRDAWYPVPPLYWKVTVWEPTVWGVKGQVAVPWPDSVTPEQTTPPASVVKVP